ncbi:MAG: efflux RND transporter periplasmic adaptor subunit, partial [Limisphaerales bacterium]
MKAKRKVVVIGIAVLLLGALVYAFLPKPVAVETAMVHRGTLETTVRDDGRTRIKDRFIVSAPLSGQLRRVPFKAGHAVNEGMILAVIEPTAPELLDPRSQAAAQARVHAAEETLHQAKSVLDRAEAALEFAQNDLRRVRGLFEGGTVPVQEMERAQMAARTTQSDFNSAKFGVRIAEYEVELARTALERGFGGNDGRSLELRAPVEGRILRVLQESATVVMSGTPIMEIGNPQNLEVEIDVLSSDAVRIQPGARVVFEYWGGPQPLEGRVRVVEPAGFLKISALGVEEQRVWVIVDFTSPAAAWQSLGDAYRVEARIIIWESNNALKVPGGALFRRENAWAAFKLISGRAELQEVQV